MTVKEMRGRMDHAEYVLWTRYHARVAQAKDLAAKMAAK